MSVDTVLNLELKFQDKKLVSFLRWYDPDQVNEGIISD